MIDANQTKPLHEAPREVPVGLRTGYTPRAYTDVSHLYPEALKDDNLHGNYFEDNTASSENKTRSQGQGSSITVKTEENVQVPLVGDAKNILGAEQEVQSGGQRAVAFLREFLHGAALQLDSSDIYLSKLEENVPNQLNGPSTVNSHQVENCAAAVKDGLQYSTIAN